MKKRFILIPLAFLAGIAATMKLVWDSLADLPADKQSYDTLESRVRAILKKRCENKLFNAEHLLDELGEPRDSIESVFGIRIEQLIENTRVETAERLLRSTDDTISCIAETAGFSDSGELYRPFKVRYDMEPSQYRDKYRS